MSARRTQRGLGGGYTLVALVVTVAVMSVLVATALPYWSQVIQRDKEAELIFRGLQYAEAIRVFQLRFNRPPNTLDELIEVNPRSIRRLWKDPMTKSGEWGLIRSQIGQPGGAGQGRDLSGATAPGARVVDQERGQEPSGRPRAVGPIIGVSSLSEDGSARSFMGGSSYSSWKFTADLIPVPVVIPDTLLVPRPTSDWIGKPFREDLQPKQGSGPPGRDLGAPRRRDGDG